ncbi:MAG: acetyltransferase [Spirochaetes bacterium RBG_13_51_14]|nr:MAG: acetyltransferase [Spirochaetes bacterium RBG_13_51_14]
MVFNSFEYIFMFLPAAWGVYFILNRYLGVIAARMGLVLCGLFFYGYWNLLYLPLLLLSIVINFSIGYSLQGGFAAVSKIPRKAILIFGLIFNIGLLGYFKYSDFLIRNVNAVAGSNISLLNLLLPLGISFFSFMQISFLVDAYRGKTNEKSMLLYTLYVTFFPYIISGPITRHDEIVPQLGEKEKWSLHHQNISAGILLFAIGLFKKTFIADTLALWANQGFDTTGMLKFFEAWLTSLSYTFQLYFDFSGYTDMAIGTALFFNIRLPQNFDSPYRSLSIQDFWRRWHISLSRFLRDYIYIPLGGNRTGEFRICVNIFVTFLVGGIWHGAGWTFIFWGMAHGLGLIIQRLWGKTGIRINKYASWFITFNFINAAWVLFRAKDLAGAVKMYQGMLGLNGVLVSARLEKFSFLKSLGLEFGKWPDAISKNVNHVIYFIAAAALISFFAKNSNEISGKYEPGWKWLLFISILLGTGLIHVTRISNFLYANF